MKLVGPGQTAEPVDLGREIHLIGGMFSGDGTDGSFRGKCYAEFVEAITATSLYEDFIQPYETKLMAQKLRAWYDEWNKVPIHAAFFNVDEEAITNEVFKNWKDVEDFVVMFEKYAGADYGLSGWW